MILGLDAWVLAVIATGAFVGATVQGIVGIGLNLVAAPVVVLVAPQLMPVVPLLWAVGFPFATLAREWREADWRGLSWAVAGRVPGTVLGVLVVAWASDQVLGIVVGVMVLVAVLLTWRAVRVPVTRGSLGAAGFIGGVTGTATSIGGPPLALLYQHHPGPVVRATLAVYFCVGALLSLAGLALVGEVRSRELVWALVLAPGLAVGFALSGPLRRHVDAGRTRKAILALCATSAVVLIVRSLLA